MNVIQKLRTAYISGCEKADLGLRLTDWRFHSSRDVYKELCARFNEVNQGEKLYGFWEIIASEIGYARVFRVRKESFE